MRLIDVDPIPAELFNKHSHYEDDPTPVVDLYDAIEIIDGAPTIEAKPVQHGKWDATVSYEKLPSSGLRYCQTGYCYRIYHCSICGVQGWKEYLYCPNCGAKMDKETNYNG